VDPGIFNPISIISERRKIQDEIELIRIFAEAWSSRFAIMVVFMPANDFGRMQPPEITETITRSGVRMKIVEEITVLTVHPSVSGSAALNAPFALAAKASKSFSQSACASGFIGLPMFGSENRP